MSLLVRNLNGQSTPHNTTLTIPLDDTLNQVLLPTSVLSNSLFCSVLFSFSMELGLPCIPELSQNRVALLVVEFPRLAAHRALLVGLRVEPLDDAVHVEAVRAGPPN